MNNSSLLMMFVKSSGGGGFDYAGNKNGGLTKYMESKGRGDQKWSSIYIARGDTYAHNLMNFGNFLWGTTGYTLGYSQKSLLKAADLNSRYNPGLRNGYNGEPDSPDDQLSITRGTMYAEKNLYRSRTTPSWLIQLLRY